MCLRCLFMVFVLFQKLGSQELATELAQFVGGTEATSKVPKVLNWRQNWFLLPR